MYYNWQPSNATRPTTNRYLEMIDISSESALNRQQRDYEASVKQSGYDTDDDVAHVQALYTSALIAALDFNDPFNFTVYCFSDDTHNGCRVKDATVTCLSIA